MDMLDAIRNRHSVRKYLDKPICASEKEVLESLIDQINHQSGLNIQLFLNEPKAFGSIIATYGLLRNVRNYIAIVGKDIQGVDEAAGYYGEQIVLKAQVMGLNTCWVAGTYKKSAVPCLMKDDERLICVIAIGYGASQGKPHRSRPEKDLYHCSRASVPEWFRRGLDAAMMAPTAVNQQKFRLTLLENDKVKAEATGGFYSNIDLGIVKCHFEIGSGRDGSVWA